MRHRISALALAICLCTSMPQAVRADGEIVSIYTTLDFDNRCVELPVEEAEAWLSCAGHGGYGILYSEGDLRQSLFFGYVGDWYASGAWESFTTFNHVNDTVEWRLRDGVPFATILRWFVDNPNPETGAPDVRHQGQVLVVSKVGQPRVGDACIVGYVDALQNADANEMARRIADTLVENFTCRTDEPQYRGDPGPFAGFPSRYFGILDNP